MEDKFVDIHAHLSDKVFDEGKAELIKKLSAEYIVLNAGEDILQDKTILEDGKHYPFILPCIGLHPNIIVGKNYTELEGDLTFIEENINKFFAVSEIGLDYKSKDTYQIQREKEFFYRILEIAVKNRKVCIIHSRKAMDDMLEILSSFNLKAVLHNFEGNLHHLEMAQSNGINISISTGFMKFKKDNIIKKVQLDRLFVETDSPVLSPDENINTPLNIPKILNYVAAIKKMETEDIKSIIYKNFMRIFYD